MATILILIISFQNYSQAQTIEKYFDYQWRECEPNKARFYGVIKYTDSGWIRSDYFLSEKRLQMRGLYKDSACKFAIGHFYFFHANGKLKSTGSYKDNKKDGIWVSYHSNGYMADSTVYVSGEPVETAFRWYSSGYLADSTVHNADGSAVVVTWFDNGPVADAGRLSPSKNLNGKWQFFHQNGKLSALEVYDNGKLVDKKYFTEDGSSMSDTTDRTRPALFAGGIPGWLKYLDKKLFWPYGYEFKNADEASVIVEFAVDENGVVKDIEIPTPFHPAFDDIIKRILKNSPKWEPAINHNRRVTYLHRQTVHFHQTD